MIHLIMLLLLPLIDELAPEDDMLALDRIQIPPDQAELPLCLIQECL